MCGRPPKLEKKTPGSKSSADVVAGALDTLEFETILVEYPFVVEGKPLDGAILGRYELSIALIEID